MEWHARTGTTMIKLHRSSFLNYEPGQFFFVNIPRVSLNEWHPFTASAVLDDSIVFYIKKIPTSNNSLHGRATWTTRLANRVEADCPPMALRLNGPFGHTDFKCYEHLLMFAGGIGITPLIAIFTDLRRAARIGNTARLGSLKAVTLVWMSRSVTEFRLFEEVFMMAMKDSSADVPRTINEDDEDANVSDTDTKIKFEIKLHCTRRDSFVSLTNPASQDYVKMLVESGRCDLPATFKKHVPEGKGADTMVAVCGPARLMYDVSGLAWNSGCDFHSEQFSF
jgi:predicted ferric reductase